MSENSVLQFSPLSSFVAPTFWHKLAEVKINFDRLSDAPKNINGFYTSRCAQSCLLEVDYSSFNSDFKPPKFCHQAIGTLYNKNTIEEFKECDKAALLDRAGRQLFADIISDRLLDDPSGLARFIVLSFADLKNHNFYYWFAFPCPLTPSLTTQTTAQRLQDIPEIQHFVDILKNMPPEQQNFFILKRSDTTKFYTLKECLSKNNIASFSPEDYYFCFADASEYTSPSWLMRTFAILVFSKLPYIDCGKIKFLGLRFDKKMQPHQSLIWEVMFNLDKELTLKFVGWEPNHNQKMGPRMASMKDSMDPEKLAENSVNLNLRLMKWRLVPDLNLEAIAATKCLLFGAGTLGCAVARNLLAWGFKHITFIDNGKVSYSNPVRQNLYTHADAVAGNAMKAKVAAARLKDINPSAITAGHVMKIPMPGHTIGASLQQQTESDLNKLQGLVVQHDVIFLLTDSRESRWLPTLLGAAFNKIVMNAALGFDSYLVMRHGSSSLDPSTSGDHQAEQKPLQIDDLKCIRGSDLGCYFCNDVTAPGNSMKDRTLDQQCTVTRPGVSNIAASYAVELLVSLLQHPQGVRAPAYYAISPGKSNAQTPEGLLGIIPHSIRGMLCNYENILPATQKFTQCIACSEKVIQVYRANGNAFLFKAFESARYLVDLTGISSFNNLANEIIDFDDSDLEMSDE